MPARPWVGNWKCDEWGIFLIHIFSPDWDWHSHIGEVNFINSLRNIQIKGESKKRWQLLDMIAQQILILGLKMIKQGQNKISRALIWDKVHLCRPNMTGDMIKNVKTVIFKKCHILHFCSINENPCFFFFIISLVIFGLQRRTLHQIKALEILFWPYVIIFSPRINICWAMKLRICAFF